MNIIKRIKTRAFWRMIEDKEYAYSETKVLWRNKKVSWNWFGIRYGIRRSDKMQYFPIWNASNNQDRALIIGFKLWHITLIYSKKTAPWHKWHYQYLPFKHRLWKFYNLVA